ncbi:MAG: RluA family pseudouridine synthase, partial [Oribacterium sp.]
MRELRIGENEAGQRLDKLLRKYLRRAENGFLYKMLRKKNITLNGRKASGKELLKEGDLLKLFFSEESFQKLCAPLPEEKEREEGGAKAEWEGEAFSSRIVYEDENLLLYNKPAGLLSQSDGSGLPSVNELCLFYLMEKGELGRGQL